MSRLIHRSNNFKRLRETQIMDFTWNFHFFILSAVVLLLFESTVMACQMKEISFEIQTTGRIPCIHNIPSALIDLVGWTKSTEDDCYVNGDRNLASSDGDRNVQNQHYGIDTDFSLVINDVTTADFGIYRCTVFPKDARAVSENDTRLTVYKYPDNPPAITYEILGGNEIAINCAHGPVFPLVYPHFPFPYQNNHTILNEDGTYMVSINAVQQFTESEITLYCSHSYPGHHQSSFLTVHHSDGNVCIFTTDPPQNKTTVQKSANHTEFTPEKVHHDFNEMVVLLSVIIVLNILVMAIVLYAVKRWMRPEISCINVDVEKLQNNSQQKGLEQLMHLMMEHVSIKPSTQEQNDQSTEHETKHSLLMPGHVQLDHDDKRRGNGLMPILHRLEQIPDTQEQDDHSIETASRQRSPVSLHLNL